MLQGYAIEDGRLVRLAKPLAALERAVWIDLIDPSKAEEDAVETALAIGVPTRAEMEEIEESSRFYREGGAAYMTADLLARADTDDPVLAPVTFILAGQRLVTLRYHEPQAFHSFAQRAERQELGCGDGTSTLLSLLEVVVDRQADILEGVGRAIDKVSRAVFRAPDGADGRGGDDFQEVLRRIGRLGAVVTAVSDSLASLERVVVFLTVATGARPSDKEGRLRLKTLGRDARDLTGHAGGQTQKLNFLLDATLGMISIEQNKIIKIFSVAAVVFLPPTLIASIYGMNFEVMPELGWAFGYPFAIGLMVLSAVLSYWIFKTRGWL